MGKTSTYLYAYILLLIAGILILRFGVPRDYRQLGKLSPMTALIQALLFFAYGGFPYLYLSPDWPAVKVEGWQRLSGLVLLYGGLGLLLYGVFRLGVTRSLGRGTVRLRESGLYRYSRNPQALACALYVVGFALLWPSWYALGWALLYGILIHLMILSEEAHLRRVHGDSYREYCRNVPRYLGWVR